MAQHICPVCGSKCNCQGDIFDELIDLPDEDKKCTHWMLCQAEDIDLVVPPIQRIYNQAVRELNEDIDRYMRRN